MLLCAHMYTLVELYKKGVTMSRAFGCPKCGQQITKALIYNGQTWLTVFFHNLSWASAKCPLCHHPLHTSSATSSLSIGGSPAEDDDPSYGLAESQL